LLARVLHCHKDADWLRGCRSNSLIFGDGRLPGHLLCLGVLGERANAERLFDLF
jgi:hypothetical protein